MFDLDGEKSPCATASVVAMNNGRDAAIIQLVQFLLEVVEKQEE